MGSAIYKASPADFRSQEQLKSVPQNFITAAERQAVFSYSQSGIKKRQRKKRSLIVSALPLSFVLLTFIIIALINLVNPPLSHLARLINENFNTQDLVLDRRLGQLMHYKFNHNPKQPVKYQILAEYREITPELAKSLRREKIDFDVKTGTINYAGNNIDARQFISNLNTNLNLSKALDDATATRRLVFQDQAWDAYKGQARLTQTGIDKQNAKQTPRQQELKLTKAEASNFRFETGSVDSSIAQLNQIAANLKSLNQSADRLEQDQRTPNGQDFANLIFVDKPNNTCSLYQTARATQAYQKGAQINQLTKLAALLLSEADKLKAGEADSEVISNLNDRLTQAYTYVDSRGRVREQKNAMDSYAQAYLSGNSWGEPDFNAQKYVKGANQALAQTMRALDKKQCQENQNFFSGLKNFFRNIWQFLSGQKPSQEATRFLSTEVKLNTTNTNLAAMTGLATAPDLSGEDLANAFAVGASELFAKNAQYHGLAVLTKNQAIAYLGEQQQLLARRAAIDRKKLSPFDINSPHTFLGSIVNKLSSSTRTTGPLASLGKLVKLSKNSWFDFEPKSLAANQIHQRLNHCYDSEYRQAHPDLALGSYCELTYGADVERLDFNPEEIINRLVKSGNLVIVPGSCDANGNYCQLVSAKKLKQYEDNCVGANRTSQIGIANTKNDNGASCVLTSDEAKDFPIFLSDLQLNQNLRQEYISQEQKLSAWPVPNYKSISSPFGWRLLPFPGMHNGIDIVAPSGADVVATHDGAVSFVGHDEHGGLGVKIKSQDGKIQTLYWHLSKAIVENGQRVKTGQKIGEIGSSGLSTGPHLHFEYHINGKPVDPIKYLQRFNQSAIQNRESDQTLSDNFINIPPGNRQGKIHANLNDYVLIGGKNKLVNFINTLSANNVSQKAHERFSNFCLSFSYYHAYHFHTNNFDLSPLAASRYAEASHFQNFLSPNKQAVLKTVYNSLRQNKPVVLQVNGNAAGTTRHFATVVGYKNHVKSASQLQEEDLLIIDSWDGDLETMDAAKSRFMFADQKGNYRSLILKN